MIPQPSLFWGLPGGCCGTGLDLPSFVIHPKGGPAVSGDTQGPVDASPASLEPRRLRQVPSHSWGSASSPHVV